MTDNNKYAVIRTGGLQYRVKCGQTLCVNKFQAEAGASVSFEDVLLVGEEGGEATIGAPTVQGATVTAKVLGDTKGKKIIAYKKKRRKGFKKKIGHRQSYTEILIEAING